MRLQYLYHKCCWLSFERYHRAKALLITLTIEVSRGGHDGSAFYHHSTLASRCSCGQGVHLACVDCLLWVPARGDRVDHTSNRCPATGSACHPAAQYSLT